MRQTESGHCIAEAHDPEVCYCGEDCDVVTVGEEFDPESCHMCVSDHLERLAALVAERDALKAAVDWIAEHEVTHACYDERDRTFYLIWDPHDDMNSDMSVEAQAGDAYTGLLFAIDQARESQGEA